LTAGVDSHNPDMFRKPGGRIQHWLPGRAQRSRIGTTGNFSLIATLV